MKKKKNQIQEDKITTKKCQSNSEVHQLQRNWFTQENIEEIKSQNPKSLCRKQNYNILYRQQYISHILITLKENHTVSFSSVHYYLNSHMLTKRNNVPVSYFTKQSMSKIRNIKI